VSKLSNTAELFAGRRFDRVVNILCVRYKRSYRDLVEMMAERGLHFRQLTENGLVRVPPPMLVGIDQRSISSGVSDRPKRFSGASQQVKLRQASPRLREIYSRNFQTNTNQEQ
jgi:hypothetical protein